MKLQNPFFYLNRWDREAITWMIDWQLNQMKHVADNNPHKAQYKTRLLKLRNKVYSRI